MFVQFGAKIHNSPPILRNCSLCMLCPILPFVTHMLLTAIPHFASASPLSASASAAAAALHANTRKESLYPQLLL